MNVNDKGMSLLEHVSELRKRVLISAIAVFGGALVTYLYVDRILDILRGPVQILVFIAPQEAFVVNLKLAFWGGVFLASPVIFFQIWKFISVALKEEEKRSLLVYGFASFCAFVGGVTFAYLVVLPLGLKFLLGFASSGLEPMLSVGKFVSFVFMLLIAFGLTFELPLVALFLTKLGLLSPEFLSRRRKHAVIGIFILAALLTPPDIVTQLFMAGPLLGLYEISILLSRWAVRKKNRIVAEPEVVE